MTVRFQAAFRALLGSSPEDRARHALELMRAGVPWPEWLEAFNRVHATAPEQEAAAAAALAAAAGRRRDRALAGRFRILSARALQRAGSPRDAVRAFTRAARDLRAAGDHEWATQADVLSVDALALTGRLSEALRRADATRDRIRGPRARLWRAALAINRANVLRLCGDLVTARRTYERAARTAAAAGDPTTAAIARTNAGTTRMDAGDADGARALFERALVHFDEAGLSDMAGEVRMNLAGALVRGGRLGEGLAQLEALETSFAARGLHRRAALCCMDLADAFLRAGDGAAAEAKALAAARAYQRSGALAERVEALWVAAAAAARHAPGSAAAHLRRARATAERAGRPAFVLRCDLLRLDLDSRRGKQVPLGDLRRILQRARTLGQADVVAQALLLRGHAALLAGRPSAALIAFSDRSLSRPGRPWVRAAAGAGRALAEARLGQRAQAIRRLRRLAAFLDAVRTTLPGPWLRTLFVIDRLDPYLARVDLLLERGRPADRREAEAVLGALAARRLVERAGERPRLDSLRRRLGAVYDALARGGGATRGLRRSERSVLESQARKLESQAAEHWRTFERRSRPGAWMPTARPASAPIPRGVTVVHLWARNGRMLALARTSAEIGQAVDLGDLQDLRARRALLSFHDERSRRSAAARPALRAALEDLAGMLLDPLAAHAWHGRVWLVIDPELPDLPWELLPLEGRPLAARGTLLRAPALRATRRRLRGVGTAVVSLGETDLPGARREARALVGRSAHALCGARATRSAVAQALATNACVHLTGHGYATPEAPGLAGIRLADGWFGVLDLPERVAADLVVLAACHTGGAGGTPGHAWGGLPLALMARGAGAVLWTADDVDDRATAALMARFHDELEQGSPAAAFGRALEARCRAQGHPAGLLDFRMSGNPR